MIGETHIDACDVARCLETGLQRLNCQGGHDCGADVWTGQWPGDVECAEYGWWVRLTPDQGWVTCDADERGAQADLNRLVDQCRWDRARARWVRRWTNSGPALLETLLAEALNHDPLNPSMRRDPRADLIDRLRVLGQLRELVGREIDDAGRAAIAAGASYAEAGQAVGLTKQRAHQRFAPRRTSDAGPEAGHRHGDDALTVGGAPQ